MKKFITRNSLTVLMLLISIMTFAQDDVDDFGDEYDVNPLDAPVAPISDYIWVLAVIGLVYVFYKMKNKVQVAK